MTPEEYGDYAITVCELRGVKLAKRAHSYMPVLRQIVFRWSAIEPNRWYPAVSACRSRREAAIKYCWRCGYIRRGGAKYRRNDYQPVWDRLAEPQS